MCHGCTHISTYVQCVAWNNKNVWKAVPECGTLPCNYYGRRGKVTNENLCVAVCREDGGKFCLKQYTKSTTFMCVFCCILLGCNRKCLKPCIALLVALKIFSLKNMCILAVPYYLEKDNPIKS